MKRLLLTFSLFGIISVASIESVSKNNQQKHITNKKTLTKAKATDSAIVYQSENLIVRKLTNHIYEHTSFLNTNDFGKVSCNGMLVVNENKAIVFDTPTDNKSSLELIMFMTKELNLEITAIIPTHFHDDCVGGIEVFEDHHIQAYASSQTIELLKKKGHNFSKHIEEFDSHLILSIGNKKVYAEYFGEGHTKDNIIGYFAEDKAIFGGCLIKEVGAGKGYLGDANTNKWSETVGKIKMKYPDAEIVIPGHGKTGGIELLEYTSKLFEVK